MPQRTKTACLFVLIFLSSFNATASSINFQKVFSGKDACFILYDLQANKTVIRYNKKRCAKRVFACSTFKIPIALMAFDQGILKDENMQVKWDGIDKGLANWNQDQTPKTWLQYSTVWVSQWIVPQIGMQTMQRYLADFKYGNQDMSGGITKAWLSSTLKISGDEQLDFLKRLWRGELAISPHAIKLTKQSIYAEVLENGDTIYGKMGSGFLDGCNNADGWRVGWFVGYLIRDKKDYVFVTNFSDKNQPSQNAPKFGGQEAESITKQILPTIFN